jgi:hypothetical protein
MAIQQTNFLEIILREIMLGKTIYEDFEDGNGLTAIKIKHLTYDPVIEQVYICDNLDPDSDGANSYKLSILENFDFDYIELKKIRPNKRKIKGKRSR